MDRNVMVFCKTDNIPSNLFTHSTILKEIQNTLRFPKSSLNPTYLKRGGSRGANTNRIVGSQKKISSSHELLPPIYDKSNNTSTQNVNGVGGEKVIVNWLLCPRFDLLLFLRFDFDAQMTWSSNKLQLVYAYMHPTLFWRTFDVHMMLNIDTSR